MIVTFNGDQITVKKVNSKTGVLAADLRDSYRDIGEQEQKKTMQKAINGEFPNIQLTSLNFTNLKSNSDTVQYEIVYKASDALIDIGGMQLFTIPWGDKTETKDFVFNESRNYPIDLWNWSANDSEQETVVINIPTTLHLSEIPKEINYTSPISDYSLSYKVEGNKLTATRHFVYKKRLITLDEVDNFRDFYKKVVLADSKPIALK